MIKFKLWSSVFLLFLFACNQEDNQPIDNSSQATAIHFTSTVKGVALTRANGASWTVNDSIGVYMKKKRRTSFRRFNCQFSCQPSLYY